MEDGEITVGAPAKRQAVTNPKATIYAVKRLIGRRFEERSTKGHRPDAYAIVKNDNGDAGGSARQEDFAACRIRQRLLRAR